MSAEPARQFVDTNVLVYAHDVTAGDKHARAKQFVGERQWMPEYSSLAGVLRNRDPQSPAATGSRHRATTCRRPGPVAGAFADHWRRRRGDPVAPARPAFVFGRDGTYH